MYLELLLDFIAGLVPSVALIRSLLSCALQKCGRCLPRHPDGLDKAGGPGGICLDKLAVPLLATHDSGCVS